MRGRTVHGSVETWGVEVTVEFRNERMALGFEKYLKSGLVTRSSLTPRQPSLTRLTAQRELRLGKPSVADTMRVR